MIAVFVPIFKFPVSYTVLIGRRWSILEHLLLIKLAAEKMTVKQLALESGMPTRLVVEALINLMRAGWIEVRSQEDGNYFTATNVGIRRSVDDELPQASRHEIRWTAVCVERLSGAWFRANDLDVVHEKDIPEGAVVLESRTQTFNTQDARLRPLLYLKKDEFLQPEEPKFQPLSRRYARVLVSVEGRTNLPDGVPKILEQIIYDEVKPFIDVDDENSTDGGFSQRRQGIQCIIDDEAILVGGHDHLEAVRGALEDAGKYIAIHSCFLQPDVIDLIAPSLEAASRRNVRIDLLWGLSVDPEDVQARTPIVHFQKAIKNLSAKAQKQITLSELSTNSHSKIIIYDSRSRQDWMSIVGSCNFLSSRYDQFEISVQVQSTQLAQTLLGVLLSIQLPASGAWPAVSRRLNRYWNELREKKAEDVCVENANGQIQVLYDHDHYACLREARDQAVDRIWIGCDLFGLAADTSTLVPMAEASKSVQSVSLFYQRASKAIKEFGLRPEDICTRASDKIDIQQIASLHGKFILWDDDDIAITSFNWMSTTVVGARARGAEIGLRINREKIAETLKQKLSSMFCLGEERANTD
ncbi:phospholipase D-like domain-containing protein [Pseudokordiimonas caeni]|uniref:phospholipase D-like domain-containing protein n=1 Tax=Pseudokordiimonas caeni TaxID=2997908 RepID=UPI00281280C2|nr:phospholipase D-like domain-containing protein [Pseudokordiimonas caeni]